MSAAIMVQSGITTNPENLEKFRNLQSCKFVFALSWNCDYWYLMNTFMDLDILMVFYTV